MKFFPRGRNRSQSHTSTVKTNTNMTVYAKKMKDVIVDVEYHSSDDSLFHMCDLSGFHS